MRDSHSEFAKRDVEILAIGPDTLEAYQRYWKNENIPYTGLPDPDHRVSKLYKQEINLFKLGRMPLNCVVDIEGRIRYVHYGTNMTDIPDNETFLNVIDKLNETSK